MFSRTRRISPRSRCPIPTGRRVCPASSSSARPSSRPPPRRPSAPSQWGRGPSPCCSQSGDDAARHLRGPAIHPRPRGSTDFCKRWGDAIAAAKIGLSFSEPTASISLISPDNYRDFIAPYHTELVAHFKAKKVGLTTHICGTTYPIYEDLIACGFATISFDLDQQADPKLHVDQLERFMQVARGRAVAIGNVDATLFERATQAQIEAEVRRCIDTAARHSGFILSTSCEIPPRSNPEIVTWFMDAAHEYGRYERVL
jgi:uroporphyrinogen decarboxylase